MVLVKKIKANTLPEVLIAIVIITFSSALGVTIYLNIQQNTQPFFKLKAQEIAIRQFKQSIQQHDYFDKTIKEEQFTVVKTVKPSEQYPDCVILKITVLSSAEKKMCELQQLIYEN
jgi:type II secretory pathway pseudopilin PulG